MAKIGKERPKDFWQTLKRIFSYISGMEVLMFVVVVLCIIAPLCRITGTAFFQVAIDNYLVPLSKNYDTYLFKKFINVVLILIGIFTSGVIASLIFNQIMVGISTKILFKMRVDLFSKMQTLPIGYFDTHKRGDIMSVYTNDVDNIRGFLTNTIVDSIFNAVLIIANATMMLYYSRKLSIIVLITTFIVAYAIKNITIKTGKLFKQQQEELGKLNGFVEEMIEGQKVIKVFNHEKQTKNDFQILNEKLYEISKNANNYGNILMPVLSNISNVGYSFVVMIGAIMVFNENMTIGIAIAFFQYARSFIFPIAEMSQEFNVVMNAMAGAERVFKLLDEKPEIDEGKVEMVTSNTTLCWKDGDKYISVKGNIDFKNVIFKYNDEKLILNNINMRANTGQKIALVGSTGAGKTTITNLINRFYDITEGEILFDEINIKNIKKDSLRKNISMVLQDTNLFTGSVMENIRYGRLDATDEDVKAAAELANAAYFIKHLPNGYDTILTDNANNLSQGEKQLLSIARAMISYSPVLILDEATSSIDTRTERLIEDGMNRLMQGRTVFIIAHRLSTVRNSDLIIVMEKGEIIEAGNHAELFGNRGKYYQLSVGLTKME